MTPLVRLLVPCALFTGFVAPASAQDEAGGSPAQVAAAIPSDWVESLRWRSIGPANMGGRVTALAVYEADPSTFYVGTATGGLLKTTNNGITFEHQFDGEATVAIGDVAVAATDPNIVWVGTGESNPRNSVSYGDGVYKSLDGGETWKNMGLDRSFQIGRIAIHPKDHDIVYVGALGRLYGPNEQRGLFKTTDGGETWEKILYVDDKTGVVDVQMHPRDPDTLLVATYERKRDGFDANDPEVKIAPGSGLYRTTDGGETFKKLTEGLPTVDLGRIGVDYYRKDPDVVYAIVESALIGKPGELVGWAGVSSEDAETGARVTRVVDDGPAAAAGIKVGDIVLAAGETTVLSSAALTEALAQHEVGDGVKLAYAREGERHTAEVTMAERPEPNQGGSGRSRGRRGGLSSGLGGQTANVQKLQGRNGHEHGGVYRSEDGGTTWQRINSINPRPMYFSQIRVDPSDEQYQFVLGIRLSWSKDRGETFTPDAGRGVHADHHAMWIDPNDGRHAILGCDGGVYVTYDRARNWDHLNHMALGQFYHVAVGPRRDYWVYGGLQDNGTWGAPHRAARDSGAVNEDWIRIGGGDGFIVRVDANDPEQIYYESQNGSMARTHLGTMEGGRIRPRAPKGTRYRYNWQTPFILSHHNSRIYYCAGNHVFRSLDRGDDLKVISPDITRTDRGSATALAESPRDSDVLYVGTDDGALWGTKDGGVTWRNLIDPAPEVAAGAPAEADTDEAATPADATSEEPVRLGLGELIPGPRWVNAIEPSRFVTGRAYVTLDGHRSDDDNPYVFVTEDFGDTWSPLHGDLPWGSTRIVREDLENPDVLWAGTEFGVYVSIDRGQRWARINNNLPTVRVDELAQHATSGEIVAGTHGRSLWILDATPVRQMTAATLAADAHLYKPNAVVRWRTKHRRASSGARRFVGANPPRSAEIYYSLARETAGVQLEIRDAAGKVIKTLEASGDAGLHRVAWDLRAERRRSAGESRRGWSRGSSTLAAGTYTAVLTIGEDSWSQPVVIEEDPNR